MDKAELGAQIRAAGVPADLVDLPGVADAPRWLESVYTLVEQAGTWLVAAIERGRPVGTTTHATEDEACRALLAEVTFPVPAPERFTDDGEAAARTFVDGVVNDLRATIAGANQAGSPTTPYLLPEHMVVDRFGNEAGTLLFPAGTPFPQRSQPPTALTSPDEQRFPGNLHRYRVARPFRVVTGEVGPFFEQPGGGVQLKFDPDLLSETPAYPTIGWLVRAGYLVRVA